MVTELADLIENQVNPTIAPYAKPNEVTLRLTVKTADEAQGIKQLDALEETVQARVEEKMKTKKLAFAAAAAATLVLGACGNNNDSSGSTESDEIVTELSEDTTVTFWHAMNGAQEESLTKLTEQFMDENPNIKIELQNQSSYSDLQAKVNSTLPSPKDLPTITQAYPGWLWNAAQDDMLVDLGEYINDDTIGWGDQEEIRSALLEGAQIDGVQYGIPFNKSTEMLFYNADMLDEYGIDVPTNLEELKEASQEIYA